MRNADGRSAALNLGRTKALGWAAVFALDKDVTMAWRKQLVLKFVWQCPVCGQGFIRTIRAARGRVNYCSRECAASGRRKRNQYICFWCGEAFKRPPHREKGKQQFCSERCRSEWWTSKKKEVACAWCEDPIWRIDRDIKKSTRFFCNAICQSQWQSANCSGENSPHWKGGPLSNYTGKSYWRNLRDKVFERDGYKCQLCEEIKEPGALVCHHVIPRRVGGADGKDNLMTLCKKCHRKAEPNWPNANPSDAYGVARAAWGKLHQERLLQMAEEGE